MSAGAPTDVRETPIAQAHDSLTILMLASSYPRDRHDTASVFLRYFAKHLHARGHSVHVLVPADRQAGSCVEEGIHVHRFAYLPASWRKLAYGSGILPNLRRNPLLWLQVPFLILAMLIQLGRLARIVKPDVIHAHWIVPQGLIAVAVQKLTGIPVIVTAHGGDAFGLRGGLFGWLKRYALNHSNAWTANTRATSNALKPSGANRLSDAHIIPMGVDVGLFSSGRRNSLRSGLADKCIILFVGRLVEKKGVDDLIRAFALLPKDIMNTCVLWIAGSGHMRPALEEDANRSGIAPAVRFWGNVSQEQLPDIYSAADIFVGPSVVDDTGDTEGQGVVFLEAASAGLAVVATRVGGIVDVIQDGQNGLLVNPRSPEALAAAIASLVRDKNLRMQLGNSARAYVRANYSWPKVISRFENLYREQLNQG